MTVQEAIEKIKWRICTASEIAGVGEDGKAFEDLEMAIEALEKQIQKKPIYKGDDYNYAVCPNCWHLFEFDVNDWETHYCLECGQAIDWSKEE